MSSAAKVEALAKNPCTAPKLKRIIMKIEYFEKVKDKFIFELTEKVNEEYVFTTHILTSDDLEKIYEDCKDWSSAVFELGEHVRDDCGTDSFEYFMENLMMYEEYILKYIEKK